MKSKIGLLLLLNLIMFSCEKKPTNSLGSEKVSVNVFTETKYQKIQSIGGNYCQADYSDHAADAIGNETLFDFRPSHVRVALPMRLSSTAFENYRGTNFTKQPLVIEVLDELKRMKNEFGVKTITVSVWDVPNELVEDSTKTGQRIVKSESYDELLDMLVAFLLKAKNDYGIDIDYFSFNEPNDGNQVLFSAQATIAFIKKAITRFEAAGLKTKFLLADTAQTNGTVEYAAMIMADSTIWKQLGPLCFHSWRSEEIPDSEFERVATFAKSQNKPVWCTELGFDAAAWQTEGMFQSWDYGLRFAKISYRTLKYAEAEVLMYWTWQNNYNIMSPDLKTMYPSYYVTRHLVNYLNNGTQIVRSESSDPEVFSICGIHEDGTQVIQLINMKKVSATVDIEGCNSTSIDMVTTTERNYWQVQKNVTKSGKAHISIQLLPESVNTLILN